MFKSETVSPNSPHRLRTVLSLGLPFALLFTVAGLFILTVLYACTALSETTADILARLLSAIVIWISAMIVGAHTVSKGWLSGILLGCFYVLILYAFRAFGYGYWYPDRAFLLSVLLTIIAGILGGSIGINLFSKK